MDLGVRSDRGTRLVARRRISRAADAATKYDGVSRTGRRRDADRAGARRAVSLVERCPATCDVWSAASGRPAAPALRGTDAGREVRGGVPRAAPHQTARLVVDRARSARARAVLVSSRGLVAARSCPAPARAGHRPARHRAHVNAARLHAGADDVRGRWTTDCALECVLAAAASEVASQSTREGEAHVCSTPAVHDGRAGTDRRRCDDRNRQGAASRARCAGADWRAQSHGDTTRERRRLPTACERSSCQVRTSESICMRRRSPLGRTSLS